MQGKLFHEVCVCVCVEGVPADQSGLRHGEEEMGRRNIKKLFQERAVGGTGWS